MAVIAIDLGGTKLAGALVNARGQILQKTLVPLAGHQGRAVGRMVTVQISNLLAAAQRRRLKVGAIGVCVPGISHSQSGKVWAPNIPGWKDYPLRSDLEASLRRCQADIAPRPALPVFIESDRACYILGEAWRGAARGCGDAIFLAVGTGIGVGILSAGRIVRGAHDSAGAIGWLALDRPFRREYAACGCFEYHASGEGLVTVARELVRSTRNPRRATRKHPSHYELEQITTRDVFAGYKRGESVAKDVLKQAVEFWGMAVANLVSLFNPETIILGGGVFGPATRFLNAIHQEAKKWAQPVAIRQVRLTPSQLGGDAGLYGAAYLALKNGRVSRAD